MYSIYIYDMIHRIRIDAPRIFKKKLFLLKIFLLTIFHSAFLTHVNLVFFLSVIYPPPPSSLLNTVKFLLIYIIPRSVPLLEVLTKGGLMRVLNNWNYIGRNNE